MPSRFRSVSQGGMRVERGREIWECLKPQEEIYLIAGPFTEYASSENGIQAMVLLRRPDAGGETTEQQFNVEIAREHLAELVKQKDSGELSDEEFAQARRDIELALAEDLGIAGYFLVRNQAGINELTTSSFDLLRN